MKIRTKGCGIVLNPVYDFKKHALAVKDFPTLRGAKNLLCSQGCEWFWVGRRLGRAEATRGRARAGKLV